MGFRSRGAFRVVGAGSGSVVAEHGLRCPAACGIFVSESGIKFVSPALAGSFLTTEPPGKPLRVFQRDTHDTCPQVIQRSQAVESTMRMKALRELQVFAYLPRQGRTVH